MEDSTWSPEQRGLSTFGRPASGSRGGGGPTRTAHKLTTHSKPLLLGFPTLHYPFFSIELVSHLTKVVHNKAGDIQFLISDLTGDCGFLISILDP